MPAQQPPDSAETRALKEILQEDDAALKRIVAESGPPPDSTALSEPELDQVWALPDPNVHRDPEGFARLLMTTGIDQQTLARLSVIKEHPEWAPLYAQPTQDAEMADQLMRLARFPYRAALLAGIGDVEEQVRFAEQRDRRYQKAQEMRPGGQAYLDMLETGGLDLEPRPPGGEGSPTAPVPVEPQQPPMAPSTAVQQPVPSAPVMPTMGG